VTPAITDVGLAPRVDDEVAMRRSRGDWRWNNLGFVEPLIVGRGITQHHREPGLVLPPIYITLR
jgi:hypothetical protein